MRKLIILLFLLPALNSFSQTQLKFSDNDIPFTISYPDTWEMKVKEGNRVFFTSPKDNEDDSFRENINVSHTANKQFNATTLKGAGGDEIVNSVKSAFTDFKLEKKSYVQLGGREALKLIYSGIINSLPGVRIRITQFLCSSNGMLYTLTYTASESNAAWDAEAMKIMNSIAYKK